MEAEDYLIKSGDMIVLLNDWITIIFCINS
jgi:hypothetical protein